MVPVTVEEMAALGSGVCSGIASMSRQRMLPVTSSWFVPVRQSGRRVPASSALRVASRHLARALAWGGGLA